MVLANCLWTRWRPAWCHNVLIQWLTRCSSSEADILTSVRGRQTKYITWSALKMSSSLPLWRGLYRLVHYPTELHQHARLLTHQVFNHPPSITTGALKNCYYSMDRDHRTTHHVSSASPGTTAAGPLLSYHYSTDWGAGTSQHTSSSQVVGIATALGLGLILCSSSKGMHRKLWTSKLADI